MKDQMSFDDDGSGRLQQAWRNVLARLKAELPAPMFSRFLKPLRPVGLTDGVATIVGPGKFITEWVRDRYFATISQYLEDELAESVEISLIAESRERPAGEAVEDRVRGTNIVEPPAPATVEIPRFHPNPRFRFDTYVTGQSNRLACAGAKAVTQEPGTKYNPLFIYGPSGLGKTHLLHAIAGELLRANPGLVVAYITAQQFAEEFVHSLQTNRIDAFRRAQRNVSVWLVDDIQFVAGKDKTSEEIFYTFNYLQNLGKQIVITSDRSPRELHLMDERLRTRFEAGLVADVQMPDTETRCAILRSKAHEERIQLTHEVAMLLAERVPGNIRQLEGALTKLVAIASIEGLQLDLDLATRLVDRHYASLVKSKPSFDSILDAVSRHFSIPVLDIRGVSRKAPIVLARHVAVYITREITGDSWKHIGSQFGDRDHTSMMHGHHKIEELMLHDRELRAAVKKLMRDLNP